MKYWMWHETGQSGRCSPKTYSCPVADISRPRSLVHRNDEKEGRKKNTCFLFFNSYQRVALHVKLVAMDNVTLGYIGPFGFATMYQFLLEVKKNTTDSFTSPFLQLDPTTGITSFPNSVCHFITNSTSDVTSWSIYENQDILNRVVRLSVFQPGSNDH